MVINAVTGNPILGVDVCYSCTELNIQACAATDSEGKLDAGKYPVNSLFNVTCTMEGYDSREDVIEVQADENVIPLNPKVSFFTLSHCSKITQNVAFEFLYFGIFHQFLSY